MFLDFILFFAELNVVFSESSFDLSEFHFVFFEFNVDFVFELYFDLFWFCFCLLIVSFNLA